MKEKNADELLTHLKTLANPENVAGMARFGISTQGTLGISIYTLRPIARQIGVNHALAQDLWASGIHEARILASYIADPALTTEQQMEAWVADFDSWDICDQVCSNLFDRTSFAVQKALQWSERPEPFVKRSGFVLMASLAVHDKNLPDAQFIQFLDLIVRQADDDRNFVKKAINWALRQIGKRNIDLNSKAIETAEQIRMQDSKAVRWIASDALRELTSEKVQKRLLIKAAGFAKPESPA